MDDVVDSIIKIENPKIDDVIELLCLARVFRDMERKERMDNDLNLENNKIIN